LSFAGKDRGYAEHLANHLEEFGLAVFYDKAKESRIFADDIEAILGPIYERDCRYVVAVLASATATKDGAFSRQASTRIASKRARLYPSVPPKFRKARSTRSAIVEQRRSTQTVIWKRGPSRRQRSSPRSSARPNPSPGSTAHAGNSAQSSAPHTPRPPRCPAAGDEVSAGVTQLFS